MRTRDLRMTRPKAFMPRGAERCCPVMLLLIRPCAGSLPCAAPSYPAQRRLSTGCPPEQDSSLLAVIAYSRGGRGTWRSPAWTEELVEALQPSLARRSCDLRRQKATVGVPHSLDDASRPIDDRWISPSPQGQREFPDGVSRTAVHQDPLLQRAPSPSSRKRPSQSAGPSISSQKSNLRSTHDDAQTDGARSYRDRKVI